MTFRVEISAEAERDVENVLQWLHEQGSGRLGIDWFLGLEDAISSLSRMPARCPIAPESARYPYEVRELQYGKRPHVYRILFSVVGDTVQVKHIRHARRRRLV